MLELALEEIVIRDPLIIFPGYRKKKRKWEQQNIKDDIAKLRKSKQSKKKLIEKGKKQ